MLESPEHTHKRLCRVIAAARFEALAKPYAWQQVARRACAQVIESRPRAQNRPYTVSALGTCRAILHTLRTLALVPLALSRAKITDRCLQLFGGYGYMEQYHPISRMYGDARVTRIYVRTNEFMKAPIARSL
jgi:hypothetical protein